MQSDVLFCYYFRQRKQLHKIEKLCFSSYKLSFYSCNLIRAGITYRIEASYQKRRRRRYRKIGIRQKRPKLLQLCLSCTLMQRNKALVFRIKRETNVFSLLSPYFFYSQISGSDNAPTYLTHVGKRSTQVYIYTSRYELEENRKLRLTLWFLSFISC